MVKSDDHLSNEVSISAKIDEKGLTGSARSRTIAALDRLGGAILDVPNAWLERKAALIREGEKAEGSEEIKSSGNPLVLTEDQRVERVIRQQDIKRVGNKKAVLEHALEDLSSSNETYEDTDDEVNDDWLNYFEGYADKASSKSAREQWGRVLAGEIRKPGRFSLRTLRFLSEVETETAQNFLKFAKANFKREAIFKKDHRPSGDLIALLELEEVGLIQEVQGTLARIVPIKNSGAFLVGNTHILLVETDRSDGDLHIPVIKISKMGRELLELNTDGNDELSFFEEASEFLFEEGTIGKSTIGRITSRDDQEVKFDNVKVTDMQEHLARKQKT